MRASRFLQSREGLPRPTCSRGWIGEAQGPQPYLETRTDTEALEWCPLQMRNLRWVVTMLTQETAALCVHRWSAELLKGPSKGGRCFLPSEAPQRGGRPQRDVSERVENVALKSLGCARMSSPGTADKNALAFCSLVQPVRHRDLPGVTQSHGQALCGQQEGLLVQLDTPEHPQLPGEVLPGEWAGDAVVTLGLARAVATGHQRVGRGRAAWRLQVPQALGSASFVFGYPGCFPVIFFLDARPSILVGSPTCLEWGLLDGSITPAMALASNLLILSFNVSRRSYLEIVCSKTSLSCDLWASGSPP